MSPSARRNRVPLASCTAGAVFGLALIVFWRTAYPTITWWDSSSYSLAAATLGIESPPGSLFLTLLGWPIAHVVGGAATARALNLFACLLAAGAAALVALAALEFLDARRADRRPAAALCVGVSLGALGLAYGDTLWSYAVMFTPYVLTALFSALILLVLAHWWTRADEPGAWRWIACLGFLFGLDFSVHRTNALLIPGAIVWILLRRPRTFIEPRAVVGAVGLLAAGIATQLLLVPIAAFGHSPLDFNSPSNLSRLWDYVSIKPLGGSFLLDIFPRKAPIWSVQSADLLRTLAANFLRWRWGAGIGAAPAVAALIGWAAVWRRDRRLGSALLALLLLQAASTVLYFDIPDNYFRTFDRHYLPVCVTIGVLAACGLGSVLRWAASALAPASRPGAAGLGALVAIIGVGALAALVPAAQLGMNWRSRDASHRYFTHDYAVSALRQLPENAIYFTVGDNDTFPVMYVQAVEGVRPDVTVINLSVANVPDWPERLQRRDPSLRLSLHAAARQALVARPWTDSLVPLLVSGRPEDFGLPPASRLPQSITLHVEPANGAHMLPAEVVLLDIARTNAWRRPLAFAITGTRSAMEWFAPYGRLDGLYFRIVPVQNAPADARLLRENLMARSDYRGYADSSVPLDGVSQRLGMQAYGGLVALLDADVAAGSLDACRADRAALLARLPLDHLSPPPAVSEQVRASCGGSSSSR